MLEALEKPFLTTWMLQAAVRELGVPGLPRHWSNIARAAERGAWKREANPRRRGGYIYAINGLPGEARDWIIGNLPRFIEWLKTKLLMPGWFTGQLILGGTPAPAAAGAAPDAAVAAPAGAPPARRWRSTGLDRDPDLKQVVLSYLAHAPRPNCRRLREQIKAEKGREVPLRTLQWWVRRLEETHAVELAHMRDPDAARSRHLPAFGAAAETILRLNQSWELDATKADLLLADGKRYTVLGCMDVATRRMKLRVVESSSAPEVGLLLRAAILDWGVPEQVVTDNGKEFTARHVARVLSALDIEHRVLPPFQPQKKPHIERGLRTFNHDLVEELEGFVGHSVAEAQALRNRSSFARRLTSGGEPIELSRLTPAELQRFCDDWCEHRYGRREHSGLGESPFAAAQRLAGQKREVASPAALDLLLREAPDGHGLRTVTKKGIKVGGHWYGADFIGDPGVSGRQVRVFLDPLRAGVVSVFDAALERWLGEALCPELLGLTRDQAAALRQKIAAEAKAAHRAGIAEFRARVRRRKGRNGRALLEADVRAAERVVALPRRGGVHSTPALGAAEQALRAAVEGGPTPMTAEEQAQGARLFAEAFGPRKPPELKYSPVTGRPITTEEAVMVRWMLANPGRCDADDRAWLKREFKAWSFRMLYGEPPEWLTEQGEQHQPDKKTGAA